jgi:hypothetical protein
MRRRKKIGMVSSFVVGAALLVWFAWTVLAMK